MPSWLRIALIAAAGVFALAVVGQRGAKIARQVAGEFDGGGDEIVDVNADAAAARVERQPGDPRRETGSSGIVVVSTSSCGYCADLKDALTNANVPFRELDAEMSEAGELAYDALNGRGVPITVVGQSVVHGYNATKLTRLLAQQGYTVDL